MYKFSSIHASFKHFVFCQKPRFRDIHAKKSKCRIQNRLGASFVMYKIAWERILNKYAVISPDKQNNDQRCQTVLSLTHSIFVLLTPLKQYINLK